MTDIVEELRLLQSGAQWACGETAKTLEQAADEIERLRSEVASLRLTLGGRTFSADVPDPVGCPAPGACAQVAEIERLRAALRRIGNPGEDVDCSKEGHTVAVLVARAALGENSHD